MGFGRNASLVGAAFGMTAVVGWVTPAIALDHYLSADSVDCTAGCGEIRWEDYSKYDGARGFAKDAWNAVGHISLGLDDASSNADLEFRDYSDCSISADIAYWEPRIGADLIALNKCVMDPLSGFDRDSVLVHELGHALRIKDHPNDGWDEYWRTRSIMRARPARRSTWTISTSSSPS